ncbi:MAG: zinc-binding dehydrogenase, partial [Armatimonadota bacterium]
AAMTEPAACALHTVRRGDVGEGDVVAVLGAGPIGLMVAQWARALGARRVVVADIVDEKLVLARRLGFDDTCNVREESLSARVAEVTGGEGARVVVEAAGVAEAVLQSIEIVQPLGIIVLMGNPTQTVVMPPAALSEVLRKQATIRGTWNSTFKGRDADDWQDALGAMADGRIEVAAVVTHEFRIGEANEAFRMMASGEEFYTKVMLSFE